MKTKRNKTPRTFTLNSVTLRHCADIELNLDEVVTFKTLSGTELDVTRKSWGYYATPSLNKRLPRYHLRAVLCANQSGDMFVLLVEKGHEPSFFDYLKEQKMQIMIWLDNQETIDQLTSMTDGKNRCV